MTIDAKLYCDSVTVKARHFNFGEGYPERWEYAQLQQCQECWEVVSDGESCPQEGCDGELEPEQDAGPTMNYFWPLPDFHGDTQEAARKLNEAGVALCLVWTLDEYDADEYGLALTGGGMDLSWDICRAYMALGFMPPLAACELPDFAGQDYSDPRNQEVFDACKESVLCAVRWASDTGSKLEALGKDN